jgi:Zn-dependent membrane protease YugP
MPVSTHIAHHVPGRMRIRVGGGKHNPHLLEKVRGRICELDGVSQIDVNSTTGSLVVHYRSRHPRQFESEIAEHGSSTGAFQLALPQVGEAGEIWGAVEQEAKFLAAHSQLARTVVQGTKQLDVVVKIATDNNVDLKVLIPLGLAVFSFIYLGTDVATPLWISLGIFSFNSFVSLHPPLPYPQTENKAIGGQ